MSGGDSNSVTQASLMCAGSNPTADEPKKS